MDWRLEVITAVTMPNMGFWFYPHAISCTVFFANYNFKDKMEERGYIRNVVRTGRRETHIGC
jgi:hypothetical protein